MTPFRLAYLSLIRHPFTTWMCAVAIGLSVACGGLLLRLHSLSESRFSSIPFGIDAVVGAKAGGIEILLGSLNSEGSYPAFLPHKLFESLKAQQTITHGDGVATTPSYIETITPFIYFGQLNQFRVVGTDGSFIGLAGNLKFLSGQWTDNESHVVVGGHVARELSLKIGDKISVRPWISESSKGQSFELEVSGILESTNSQWDRLIFGTVGKAHKVLETLSSQIQNESIWGPQVLNYFLIKLRPNGFLPLASLVNKRTVGQVIDVQEQKKGLQELAGLGQKIGIVITGFIVLLGGLTVSSMLATRFEGMSTQLAIMRSIGYRRSEISKWLLWEGVFIGLLGIVIGAALDFMIFPQLRSLLGDSLPTPDIVSISIFKSSLIWGVALFSVVTSIFIPIVRTYRQDAHSTLRGL